MKFVDNIPMDTKAIVDNRTHFMENRLKELQTLIVKNHLFEAYPKFGELVGQSLDYRSVMSDQYKEKMRLLCQNYIDKIQEVIVSNQNGGYPRLLINIQLISQWILNPIDPSAPISSMTFSVRNRLEGWQDYINNFKDILTKEEVTEINFLLSHMRIIVDKASSSDVIDLGTAMYELGTEFYEYIKTQPLIYDGQVLSMTSMLFCTEMLEIGKVDIAETIANFGLELAIESSSSGTIMGCLQMVANCYRHQGKLDLALEYYKKMIGIEDLPYAAYAYPIRYIGYILQTRGEIDQALKYYQISLNLFESRDMSIDNNKTPIARTLQNIASIYYLRADFNKALEYSEKSLDFDSQRRLKNPRFTVDLLYHQILTLLEYDQIDTAKQYFNQISKLQEEFTNPIIEQLYNLTKALILKRSKRIKHKAEAQRLLESITQGPVLNHEYSVVAIQNLCDMLIDEMSADYDEETFKETSSIIQGLLKLAEDQQLHLVKVNTLLLQARFDIVRGESAAGLSKISAAQTMCESKKLNQLLDRVAKFREKYLSEIEKWKSVFQDNISVKEKLANKEIQDYLKMALSAVTS